MVVRTPDSAFTLANFMRTNLYASLAVLKTGLDILAAALNTPVSVMETAGEGGAWGMALLASYMVHKKDGETLYKRTFH